MANAAQFEVEIQNLEKCLPSYPDGARLLRVLWTELSRGATIDHLIHRIQPNVAAHPDD